MLKSPERYKTQSICAGLIASTIVTADCADDACICATSIDATCPSATVPGADKNHLLAAELPVEGTVLYSLDPVITSLPTDPAIAVANLPADLEVADGFVDSVSQADALAEDSSDEHLPRLTRARRRSPSNQKNSAQHVQDMVRAPLASLSGELASAAPEIAAYDVEVPLPQEARQPAPKPRPTERSLLQDAYIAFGVNGR